MNLIKTVFAAAAALGFASAASAAITVNSAEGWLESAFVEWAPVSGASSYTVLADGKAIDNQLIRNYGSYMRADVLGLKAGSHTLQVKSDNGEASAEKTVTVKAHDRSGFGFSNGRVPGAYNTDGTLKSGAVVVYVTENTKNKVTMDVTMDSKGTKKTCLSFQGILNCMKKGYETRPVDFRFIGTVTDSDSLVAGDMVIETGSSENSYVTVEGVGNDATANGWGIRLKSAQNVEVRNMGIMNVNSSEGDNIGLQQNNQYVWVHNNDMFYGDAGSDKDQVKGDGALDCKKSTYITFSYNHFWDNGKSNLLGLSEGTTEGLYITYHHNWYDHSDSRHPRVRFYSAHVYNNYYDGNAKYGIGSTLGSSVFAEANYFRNCKYPMMTSMQGSDVYAGTEKRDPTNYATFSKENGGSIKAFNNYIEGGTFIPYGASKYTLKGSEVSVGSINTKQDFDAYVITSRNQEMPSTVTSYAGGNKHNNFDLSGSMYKYTADAPADAKANVTKYAGRVQGGDFKWTFTAADDELYEVNQPLKNALVAYKTSLKAVQGEGSMAPIETPVTSSSSVVPASSSSSVNSSSSVKPASSSSVGGSEGATGSIKGDIVHNFTEDALSSDVFDFMGTLSTSKGTVDYAGETLSRCLKMESATSIDFTLESAGKMTLVFNDGFTGAVKIDGSKVSASNGVVEVELAKGAHSITKGDVANLYLIVIKLDGSAIESSSSESDDPASSSSDEKEGSGEGETESFTATVAVNANPLFYNSRECRLEVSGEVRRLDILRMDGRKVRALPAQGANGMTFDLNDVQPGVYLVRALVGSQLLVQKIVKK